MTTAQQIKLQAIEKGSKVFNHFETKAGLLAIDTTCGTNRFMRLLIGPRGGICGTKVYRGYDHEDKEPFGLISTDNG